MIHVLTIIAMFIINFYAVHCLVVALKARGRPWQNAMSGVGAVVTMTGWGLMIVTAQDPHAFSVIAFGRGLLMLGVALMLLPKIWARVEPILPSP